MCRRDPLEAAHDPPDRAEEANEWRGGAEGREERQPQLQAPQLGVEGEPHRALDALATFAGRLGLRPRLAALSASPADMTRPAGSRRSVADSSCGERAEAARASCSRAARLAAPSRQSLSMITAQLHTEAASSNRSTPLTTGSAFMNSLTIERVAAGSVTISL